MIIDGYQLAVVKGTLWIYRQAYSARHGIHALHGSAQA
jgi:hypothetical protein